MSKNKKKKDKIDLILNIVIVLMVLILLAIGQKLAFHISFAKDASTFMQKAESMSFELEQNNYAALIQGKYINEINGNKEALSYHAFADYVEASVKHKVFVKKGNQKAASEEQLRMDRALSEMGSLTPFAGRVDEMIGLD